MKFDWTSLELDASNDQNFQLHNLRLKRRVNSQVMVNDGVNRLKW